jgi:hypothetical protein
MGTCPAFALTLSACIHDGFVGDIRHVEMPTREHLGIEDLRKQVRRRTVSLMGVGCSTPLWGTKPSGKRHRHIVLICRVRLEFGEVINF